MKRLCYEFWQNRYVMVLGVVIMIFSITVSVSAQNLPPDAAIVVGVSGNVMYQNRALQQNLAQVQPFMKIYQNDQLTLPPGTQVKLLYLQNGQQETWQGQKQIVLTIGQTASQVSGVNQTGIQPQVRTLQHPVRQRIVESVLPFSPGRIQGGTQRTVRPGIDVQQGKSIPAPIPLELTEEELDEIKAAEVTYNALKKERETDDDVIPEVYLLSVYAEYELDGKMEKMIGKLLEEYPNNPILKQWQEWVKHPSE